MHVALAIFSWSWVIHRLPLPFHRVSTSWLTEIGLNGASKKSPRAFSEKWSFHLLYCQKFVVITRVAEPRSSGAVAQMVERPLSIAPAYLREVPSSILGSSSGKATRFGSRATGHTPFHSVTRGHLHAANKEGCKNTCAL